MERVFVINENEIEPLGSINEDEVDLPRFTIEGEINRQYRRFGAEGTQLTVRLLPPHEGEDSNPMSHFMASVTDLFEYALRNCDDSDMVGITITNEVNVSDRAIGISFRRKDQITSEVIWSVLGKVAQSNARFNALDKLIMTVHSVKMPAGNGKKAIVAKGRPLETMVHLKKSIVQVKAESNCLAHALVIAKAKVDGDDKNYQSYRRGRRIRPVVDHLLETTGLDLSRGGGVPELLRFQHFKEYRIVVFKGLDCKDLMFDGKVDSKKRLNLVYDEVHHHFHVINNVTGALSQNYFCKGCNKGYGSGVTHRCQETCSDCMSVPPCPYHDVRIPCGSCNRQFRSRTCFDKHKINKIGKRTVCEKKRNCTVCNSFIGDKRHECFKPRCTVIRTKRLDISVLCNH